MAAPASPRTPPSKIPRRRPMRGLAKASKSAPWRFSEFFAGKAEQETGGDFMERGHQVDIRNVAYFRHDYDGEHADMRHLYEQAKLDQWNAATDIDWSQ